MVILAGGIRTVVSGVCVKQEEISAIFGDPLTLCLPVNAQLPANNRGLKV